ncbi:hypothetical protein FBEOM_2191 [Fusarium beomiforme]|uniref:PiggyBac transposable element-derived protein domain-containing protein n=1 Tax=Fusarium beomiforme TaxID=44412 RepID=A0A9P5E3S6_9HYPO|nr:hypothetical protein FBEOM_2191 [Fusarium beomiforme]
MADAPAIAIGNEAGRFNGTGLQLRILVENSHREQDEDSTVRPDFKPTDYCGTHFDPFPIEHRDFNIHKLPSTPLKLRQSQWKPTSAAEIWIWIGILLYMQNDKEYRFVDHWRARTAEDHVPDHNIVKSMTYNRFHLLKRRLRLDDPDSIEYGVPHPFSKVNEWSDIIQTAATELFIPGTNISVDEGIIGFEGKSIHKITIPNKPTDTGLKIWQLSQRGYLLRWTWHVPGSKYGPIGVEFRRGRPKTTSSPTKMADLNPTQDVVAALASKLPAGVYHVFLDNLFSAPDLFVVLGHLGIGATGTCRTNCGLYRQLVKLKAADKTGKSGFAWGQLEAWPTVDNLVNQIAWKDNALVLFLSTVNTGHEVTERLRHRPTTTAPYAQPIKQKFGDKGELKLPVPSVAADYNDLMNGVDISDHYRSNELRNTGKDEGRLGLLHGPFS